MDQQPGRTAYRPLAFLFGSVLVLALTLTWTCLGMRAVMDIGGACAEGGPYVPVQDCPDAAAVLLSVGIPLMVIATFVGTAVAVSRSAPDLLVPMWALLFGSLGWNFLEYGAFTDGLVWGWLVCGIVFELMALPAVLVLLRSGRVGELPITPGSSVLSTRGWWAAYLVVGAIGLALGIGSYSAWS